MNTQLHRCTHKRTTSDRKKRGFTAVEVVIGATLMTTLIVGMLNLLKQGNYLVELSRDNTRVTQILQSEIEDLRTLNWNDLVELDGFQTVTPQGRFVSTYASDYYCYRYVIDSYDNPTDKKWVWVYAAWTDSMSRTHWTYVSGTKSAS